MQRMKATWLGLFLAVCLLLTPRAARADGEAPAGALVLVLGTAGLIEAAPLAAGTAVAAGSYQTANGPRPNHSWYTAGYVLGGLNLAIGSLYGGAFADACFKVDQHRAKENSVFQNNLNVLTLGLALAHVSVALLDVGFALRGSLHAEPSRFSISPVVGRDQANHPMMGASFGLSTF